MRPIRVTGVNGTSAWIPLDTYSPAQAVVNMITGGVAAVEWTAENPFDASITPDGVALTLTNGGAQVPAGARAVRGTGMIVADVLTVSQQGIA